MKRTNRTIANRDNIRKSLERLARYEKLADEREKEYEDDPENIDRENAADAAYNLVFNEYVYAVHLISRFTGMSEYDAQQLVNKKRKEVMSII